MKPDARQAPVLTLTVTNLAAGAAPKDCLNCLIIRTHNSYRSSHMIEYHNYSEGIVSCTVMHVWIDAARGPLSGEGQTDDRIRYDDPATGRHGEAHGLPFWNVDGERRRARRARQHFSLRTFRKLGRFQRRH